ncbi:hypothetical protein IE077_001908 [Cardiosporidium cionae]|uniref:Uncharacterized protein n=1 Tax=Cardiosporidium cionae TaxID=476202 RepID=A0ABQ7JC55_9APIC|nr:hypothetical protein IE077_001908 [Cardiosporidium cionae]|eukprot:KAF8821551.1 hypothetical protein IE077_001908 [Cardiosporidium cionae]
MLRSIWPDLKILSQLRRDPAYFYINRESSFLENREASVTPEVSSLMVKQNLHTLERLFQRKSLDETRKDALKTRGGDSFSRSTAIKRTMDRNLRLKESMATKPFLEGNDDISTEDMGNDFLSRLLDTTSTTPQPPLRSTTVKVERESPMKKAHEFVEVARNQRRLLDKVTAFEFRAFLESKKAKKLFPEKYRFLQLRTIERVHYDLEVAPARVCAVRTPTKFNGGSLASTGRPLGDTGGSLPPFTGRQRGLRYLPGGEASHASSSSQLQNPTDTAIFSSNPSFFVSKGTGKEHSEISPLTEGLTRAISPRPSPAPAKKGKGERGGRTGHSPLPLAVAPSPRTGCLFSKVLKGGGQRGNGRSTASKFSSGGMSAEGMHVDRHSDEKMKEKKMVSPVEALMPTENPSRGVEEDEMKVTGKKEILDPVKTFRHTFLPIHLYTKYSKKETQAYMLCKVISPRGSIPYQDERGLKP